MATFKKNGTWIIVLIAVISALMYFLSDTTNPANKTMTIAGGIIILLAIYWIFEKGPKKGLIVDEATKNMRRRRR